MNKLFLPLIGLSPREEYLTLLENLAEESKKEVLLNINPREGVKELLVYAKKKGLKIIVFTGSHEIHASVSAEKSDFSETLEFKKKQIEILGLKKCIDEIIPASLFGGYKPQRKVFEKLLKHLGCFGESCVIVGNSEYDMAGQDVGMSTILIGNKETRQWKPKYKINNFSEIKEILGRS